MHIEFLHSGGRREVPDALGQHIINAGRAKEVSADEPEASAVAEIAPSAAPEFVYDPELFEGSEAPGERVIVRIIKPGPLKGVVQWGNAEWAQRLIEKGFAERE